ncbi:MAG TPA: hypothetical protein VEK15_25165 [Vicinamibacteria bacterium]|nr:hypothetical protein [Vicinamibacteria bacterium]
MVEISHRERVVRVKIVYYGPAAGGKTTNLVVLHRRADPARRSEMVSVTSTQDRTILLDLLPVKTPSFRGYDLRFQVIAVPGQRMYAASRKLLLNGADAIVFVANSATDRWEDTLQSLREMNQYLLDHGLDPATIPMTFQYNKQDLPDVTPLEAMERTLNARKTRSFPAVAIRESGVLETFAAALRSTMDDISERFKLGAGVRNGRSIDDWLADSMRMMFAWTPSSESDTFPVFVERMGTSPSAGAGLGFNRGSQQPNRVAVKVPVARLVEGGTPSAATSASNPLAAEALVDSYAQAAVELTSALEEMRDQRDSAQRLLLDIGQPFEAAQSLAGGASPDDVLKSLLMRIAEGFSATSHSLSLARGTKLVPAILHGLRREPLFSILDSAGRPLAESLLESKGPIVHAQGDGGPLEQVLYRSEGSVASVIVIPIRNPVQTLGFACFYLSPSSAPLPAGSSSHLERIGSGLALVLELVASRIARGRVERLEESALVGKVSELALFSIGPALHRLSTTLEKLSSSPLPESAASVVRELRTDVSGAQQYREAALAFKGGQPSKSELIPLGPVFESVRACTEGSLSRNDVTLETVEPPSSARVRADAFLLRSVLTALVERSEQELEGYGGGRIRLSARFEGDQAYILVADNAASVRSLREPGQIARTLEHLGIAWPLSFVDSVVQRFHGEWSVGSSERGNEVTVILPAQ